VRIVESHRLFSYGTLRQSEVQAALFGRTVPTFEDALPGYSIEWVTIVDPAVIRTSGADRHPILRRSDEADLVVGARLTLSAEELDAADAYEVDDYTRVLVTLASGYEAWVYVATDDAAAT
jgi:gamma-glutamylcyclotransferase (GGCT)/AIG2-like uncharacterized protein YtfP